MGPAGLPASLLCLMLSVLLAVAPQPDLGCGMGGSTANDAGDAAVSSQIDGSRVSAISMGASWWHVQCDAAWRVGRDTPDFGVVISLAGLDLSLSYDVAGFHAAFDADGVKASLTERASALSPFRSLSW